MSNAEIIKALENLLPLVFNEAHKATIQAAIDALKESEWIPVTERLPEEKDAGILKKLGVSKRSGNVLVTVRVRGEMMTDVAWTQDGTWEWSKKYAFPDFEVIAWMPRPEPYKPKETE